jgi:hypothetical protein
LPELNTNFAQLAEEVRKQALQEAKGQVGAKPEEDETENKK